MESDRLGRFTLHSLIATGGMGEVFVAVADDAPGQYFALKRLVRHLAQDSAAEERFAQEARLASTLIHPNIVRTYGLETDGEARFLAMELVQGRTLRAALNTAQTRHVRCEPSLAAFIVSELLKGLSYAHAAVDPDGLTLGLLHGDVTPENVLLSFDGAVKLSDFGAARMATALDGPARARGKAPYVAPEVVRGGSEVDARADLYSVGVLLHELLTGKRPACAPETMADLDKPRAGYVAEAGVPAEFVPVLTKALAPDLAERIATAAAMEASLRPLAKGATSTDVSTWLVEVFGAAVVAEDVTGKFSIKGTAVLSRASSVPESIVAEHSLGGEAWAPRLLLGLSAVAALALLFFLFITPKSQVIPAPPQATVQPLPEPEAIAAVPAPADVPETGTVVFAVPRGWDITFRGQRLGRAPLTPLTTTPGPAQVVLKGPKGKPTQTLRLEVVAGAQATVRPTAVKKKR